MPQPTNDVRKPWVALAFSLATPGLGHLYCGRPLKAGLLVAAGSLMAPVWLAAAYARPTPALFACLLAAVGAVVVSYVYAPLDAYGIARRGRADYRTRRYNRPAAYVLFVVAGWLAASGVTHLTRQWAFQAFYIPAESMQPNLRPGDYLLANKRAFGERAPRPGDVAVFRDPANAAQWLVKRVVACPGDTLEIRAGRVFVNGTAARERQGSAAYPVIADPRRAGTDVAATRIPADHYFLLGDNRVKSRDSRHFGPVAGADIVGAVQYIYLPADFDWSRFGVFAQG